ncbi:MAG: NADH-quinone oxidoreductase subunit H [Desulfobulbaceae bacterium]|nr:NADH-quinone oxidoreductase subunit H [Desulfobulbaceae bacterium]
MEFTFSPGSLLTFLVAFSLAPLFMGVILKVKAFFGGKQGPPWLIKYYTLFKLLRKGSVYSTSTTFVFKLGPVISFVTAFMLLLFFPFAGLPPVLSFHGDVVILFYLLGLGRFFTVLAALDTASPFEGMGAAREVFFSALAEATVFVILALFFRLSGSLSFAEYFSGSQVVNLWSQSGALILLVLIALFIVLLTENSRVPVDDPATHLELTMIHEVMILDHSGPDLALIEMGAFCKMLFYSSFISSLLYPFHMGFAVVNLVIFAATMTLLYAGVGLVESITARYKMDMVPNFILTSFALVFFATILTMEFIQ